MAPPPPFSSYKTFILHETRFTLGDTVMIKSPHAQGGRGTAPDFIAAIERIHTNKDGEVFVDGRWYYRPEETAEGRKPWHGTDELIDSDHVDAFHVRCVNAMCAVLPLKKFEELGGQCAKDDNGNTLPTFFCRSKYLKSKKRLEKPLETYCACKQPQNPDMLLVSCDSCDQWYHGKCVKVSRADAEKQKKWKCPVCLGKWSKRPDRNAPPPCWPWDTPRPTSGTTKASPSPARARKGGAASGRPKKRVKSAAGK
eukprot:m.602571 g.602571  ORF g.602571 m.602571 type:complete len:254 (+) comp22447_c0_seq2:1997-2758(+)